MIQNCPHTFFRKGIMTKGLWVITSGESYDVRANSEEEALAKFYVSQGHMSPEDYPQFKFEFEFEGYLSDVEYNGADTIAEFITEL